MLNSTSTPTSNLFKKKRPQNLTLTLNHSPTAFPINATKPLSSHLQTCTTPEIKIFIKEFVGNIEELITYNNNKDALKNGKNGVVRISTLFLPPKNKSFTLVKKQGGASVEREIKITNAIKNTISSNFPYHLFALPVFQKSNQTIHFFYTCYRKLGDLKMNRCAIQEKLQLEDSSTLCNLFCIIHQLAITLDALHNSKFKDENGKIHEGIIHNDIKPDNIFLKENGKIELADFGCAYYKDEPASQFSTYYFTAPEIWNNPEFCKNKIKNIDKADIWSLGATLMYILKNKTVIAPPENPDNEFEKILTYKTWAENYNTYWEKLFLTHQLDFYNDNLKDKIDKWKERIKISKRYLEINIREIISLKQLLEDLALLMLAPIEIRPDAKEIKNRLEAIDFVIDNESENFCTNNQNAYNSSSQC